MTAAFLALDYMVGVADQSYAAAALQKAVSSLEVARERGLFVAFTKVGFRPGHPEVAASNPVFGKLLGTDQLVGASSRLVDALRAAAEEPVLDKARFSAFASSGLWTILRARGVTDVVMCGLSTSGVVLSTALELIDADVRVTVLSDACADPDANVHAVLMDGVLAHRAQVVSVDAWTASTAAPKGGAA